MIYFIISLSKYHLLTNFHAAAENMSVVFEVQVTLFSQNE